jgi:hypothetical protein
MVSPFGFNFLESGDCLFFIGRTYICTFSPALAWEKVGEVLMGPGLGLEVVQPWSSCDQNSDG